MMFPDWLRILSVASLGLGIGCALIVLVDVVRRPQKMAVMNVVWPVTATFGSVLVLAFYLRYGRADAKDVHEEHSSAPFPVMVAKGALHCGAGCTIGDVIAETLAFAFPVIAVGLGWTHLFDEKIYAVWILDFACAFVLGIAFQYFAIVPMRKLSPLRGIVAALKADALSLAAWQVGMYGFMAFAQFYVFAHVLGRRAEPSSPVFWFAMQLAMLAGFVTAYPVNAWLLSAGIKEKM